MTPGTYNITIYRGGTFDIELTGSDADGSIIFSETYTTAALNIYEAWWDDDDVMPPPLFEMTTTNGMITIAGASIKLHVPAEFTQSMTFNSGVYQLKLITDGIIPIVDYFLVGSVTVKLPH